jgi:Xaa-Pro aminopeptidase
VSAHVGRADRLSALLEDHGVDFLLVTSPVNVRYLTGFTGTSGLAVVGPHRRVFVTDFRYVEQAAEQAPDYEHRRGKEDLLGSVLEVLEEAGGTPRLGFDDAHMTVKAHARLAGLLGETAGLEAAGGLVERLRAVKDPAELEAVRRAAALGDEVYGWLVSEHGLAGHTEREVAGALERRARDLGAERVSFPPIVAAGAHGALPHAEPRNVEIPPDTLVVVDFGVVLDGYCSDCTRTFATGEVDGEAREVYDLVRSAQEEALGAVVAGAQERAVDAVARDQIERAGRGEQFGHGLGHGVGMEVHEAPRLAPSAKGALEAGNVVTVEPGVYVPGRFGVRIEDLVVVGNTGAEVLTTVSKELTVV